MMFLSGCSMFVLKALFWRVLLNGGAFRSGTGSSGASQCTDTDSNESSARLVQIPLPAETFSHA